MHPKNDSLNEFKYTGPESEFEEPTYLYLLRRRLLRRANGRRTLPLHEAYHALSVADPLSKKESRQLLRLLNTLGLIKLEKGKVRLKC